MMRPVHLIALAMMTAASPAWAHAFLQRAEPPVGSVVAAPHQLVLTFTEGVEPLFSTVELRNAQGAAVPISKPATAPGDNRRLVSELPALSDGTYQVIWHVTSVDTHKTEGSFKFTVK